MRLLVADDDSSLRLALRLVLEDAGYEVLEAATVEEARRLIASDVPDFVLIDAGMSQEGVALWDELLLDIRFKGRALLLTGDLRTLGVLGHHQAVLSKPFDYDRLLRRIENAGRRPGRGGGMDTRADGEGGRGDDVIAPS